MADQFLNVQERDNPADRWFAITPGAGVLAIMPRAVMCTATGNITMEDAGGTSITLTAVAANEIIPLRPNKVTAATGTWYGLY